MSDDQKRNQNDNRYSWLTPGITFALVGFVASFAAAVMAIVLLHP